MKVFVTTSAAVYDDPYEGRTATRVTGAYSSREKARDAIKNSADEMLRSLKTGCGGNCEECSEEEMEHCYISIFSDTPDRIQVSESSDCYYNYNITEIELDQ